MASEVKLKNNLKTEGRIYHKDGDSAKEVSIGEIYNSVNSVVNVKDFGAVGDGVTDDTIAIQTAVNVGGTIFFPNGVYITTTAIALKSGTTIKGVFGKSIIKPTYAVTGTNIFDGSCFINENFEANELTDSNIVVDSMMFDFTNRQPNGAFQRVGVFMRYVENVKVTKCQQITGGDLVGYMFCKNTETTSNIAYETNNCAYDHWASSGNIIVTNNIVNNVTNAPNQCIQVTGDDTDVYTTDLLNSGTCDKIIIANNIINVLRKTTNSGIILNNLESLPTINEIIVNSNYVKGADFGIVVQGKVNNFSITSNIITDIETQSILLFTSYPSDTDTYPSDFIISNNKIKDAVTNCIDIVQGIDGIISGNKVSGTLHNIGINLRTQSSDIVVEGNKISSGTTSKITNNGVDNIINTPDGNQSVSLLETVFALTSAPTTYTQLDISDKVGKRKAVCNLRVINSGATESTYVFRTNGAIVETYTSIIGTGTTICTMQNGEHQYVQATTDENGILEWISSTGNNTQVIIESFHIIDSNTLIV